VNIAYLVIDDSPEIDRQIAHHSNRNGRHKLSLDLKNKKEEKGKEHNKKR